MDEYQRTVLWQLTRTPEAREAFRDLLNRMPAEQLFLLLAVQNEDDERRKIKQRN